MDIKDIKKISKHFGIPELEIINFLAAETKKNLEEVLEIKNNFLAADSEPQKRNLFNRWLERCKSFEDFEELYVYAEDEQQEELIIKPWLASCARPRQAKEMFFLIPEGRPLKREALKSWIVLGKNNLDDLLEARSYTLSGSEEFRMATDGVKALF